MTSSKVNPSPKARFLGIKHCVDKHRDLIAQPDLNSSMEQSLLEYQWQLCGGNGVGTLTVQAGEAASNFYKILGAHEFVKTFRNLAEEQQLPPAHDRSGEISHQFK